MLGEKVCVGLLVWGAVWAATSALAFVFSIHTHNEILARRWAASFAASSVCAACSFGGLL